MNAAITHYADKFGRHDLKFGAEFERSKTRDRYGYTNGLSFYDYGGVPYYAYSYGYDISGTNNRIRSSPRTRGESATGSRSISASAAT